MVCNKIFSERLFKLIKGSGKSVNQIERELGYSRNSLSNYKTGAEPSATRLVEIADYFEVTSEYLVGFSEELNPKNRTLKDNFMQLSSTEKLELFNIYQEWLSNFLGGESSLDVNFNIVKKDEFKKL